MTIHTSTSSKLAWATNNLLHVFIAGPGTGVSLSVRAPTDKELTSLLQNATAETVGRIANRISLVLELTMGKLSLVFGGDMPARTRGANVPEGWPSILKRHQHLGASIGLKVSASWLQGGTP